jgi:hypothetical protein
MGVRNLLRSARRRVEGMIDQGADPFPTMQPMTHKEAARQWQSGNQEQRSALRLGGAQSEDRRPQPSRTPTEALSAWRSPIEPQPVCEISDELGLGQ